jgi:MHS family shikimate/dehydroshikimate transporter-like MFS transporter
MFVGGLTPLIATALLLRFNGASWPIALYLIGLAVITLICAFLLGETRPKMVTQVETPAEAVKAGE